MNFDAIEIILILWLIERVSIERSRYKLTIEFPTRAIPGYWAIWIYHKPINGQTWWRSGGRRLIHFEKYVIPKIG